MYTLTYFPDAIIRDSDDVLIVISPTIDPSRYFDPLNKNYLEYKKWESAGNTPKPRIMPDALTLPGVDLTTTAPTQLLSESAPSGV